MSAVIWILHSGSWKRSLVPFGPDFFAVMNSFFMTHCKQADIQPRKNNLDPLLPLNYRLVSKLLFSSKPHENTVSWQLFRCVGKYQYIRSIPICNGLFICFWQPAPAPSLKPKTDVSLTMTPAFIGSQWNLMIDLNIIILIYDTHAQFLLTWCTYVHYKEPFCSQNSEPSRGRG